MWIYELTDWPSFNWDDKEIALKLSAVRYQQGLLLGKLVNMGFELKREASLKTLTNDVVKSSEIEGEILNPEEVRSSIARHLGMDIAGLVSTGRDVDGIVEMMLDATQRYNKPLTKDRLFDWHASLFPTGRSGMHHISVGNGEMIKVAPCKLFQVLWAMKKSIMKHQLLLKLKMKLRPF